MDKFQLKIAIFQAKIVKFLPNVVNSRMNIDILSKNKVKFQAKKSQISSKHKPISSLNYLKNDQQPEK